MPQWKSKTVAVFGGCFDPPTKYHYQICYSLLKLGIDELRLLPAKKQPLKNSHDASFGHRVNMLERLIWDLDTIFDTSISISMADKEKSGPSFTVDTMINFQAQEPDTNFILVIGSDNLLILDQWKDHEKLCQNFHILSFPRDPTESSSSLLREALYLRGNTSSKFLEDNLAPGVLDYVNIYNLYR